MSFKNEIYTPGRQTLGKPEIKRYDEDIQAQYDAILKRRRELSTQQAAIKAEQVSILDRLGVWVAEGCDWREYTHNLVDLRAEAEAIDAALNYLYKKVAQLKRANSWLVNR